MRFSPVLTKNRQTGVCSLGIRLVAIGQVLMTAIFLWSQATVTTGQQAAQNKQKCMGISGKTGELDLTINRIQLLQGL